MRTIHKFELAVIGEQIISIPSSAIILDIQEQNGVICLWAELDDSDIKFDRNIYMTGTGQEINFVTIVYIATVQKGGLVWHFYE